MDGSEWIKYYPGWMDMSKSINQMLWMGGSELINKSNNMDRWIWMNHILSKMDGSELIKKSNVMD